MRAGFATCNEPTLDMTPRETRRTALANAAAAAALSGAAVASSSASPAASGTPTTAKPGSANEIAEEKENAAPTPNSVRAMRRALLFVVARLSPLSPRALPRFQRTFFLKCTFLYS